MCVSQREAQNGYHSTQNSGSIAHGRFGVRTRLWTGACTAETHLWPIQPPIGCLKAAMFGTGSEIEPRLCHHRINICGNGDHETLSLFRDHHICANRRNEVIIDVGRPHEM